MNKIVENYSEFVGNQINEAKGTPKFLTSKYDVFCVKFKFNDEVYFFENDSNEFAHIYSLAKNKEKGVEYIKRFDGDKFVKIGNDVIKTLFGNNTENQIALEKLGIIK